MLINAYKNRSAVTMRELVSTGLRQDYVILTLCLKPAQHFSSQSTIKLKPKGEMILLAY